MLYKLSRREGLASRFFTIEPYHIILLHSCFSFVMASVTNPEMERKPPPMGERGGGVRQGNLAGKYEQGGPASFRLARSEVGDLIEITEGDWISLPAQP
jgi:hypothetical protein